MRLCRNFVLACAVCIYAAPVSAQEGAPLPGPEGAKPTFTLAPSVSLADVGIDTNILATSVNPLRDTTGRLTLQAEPSSHLGHVDLKGRTNVGASYYRQYTPLRSVDTDNMGRIDVRINRVSVFGSGSVLRASDVFGPEVDIRTRRTETGVEGGAGVRVSRRTELRFTGRHTRTEFDAEDILFQSSLRDELTRATDTVEVQVRSDATPLTTIVFVSEAQRDRFVYVPERDTGSLREMIGIETKPSAMLAGKASVGYRLFRPNDSTAQSVSTLAASADLVYTLAEATRLGIRVTRDLGNSYRLTQRYYLVTDVVGTVTHRLTPSWDLTGTAGRQYLTYPDIWLSPADAEAGLASSSLPDRYLRFSLGVIARLGRMSTVTVTGESYHRESELPGSTYDRLRLVSGLVVAF